MITLQNTSEILSTEELQETNLKNNFGERSEITLEIISRKPGFLEKWALLIFLFLLVLLGIGTSFIRYPDMIQGAATLVGNNAPKEIVPKVSGKLTALFVKNNQAVTAGEIIGWLESTASATEVIELNKRLQQSTHLIEQGSPEAISVIFNQRFGNLGELQQPYQTFITAWQQYNDYLVNGYYYNRKHLLANDISALRNMGQITDSQRLLTQKDNELARKSFDMNESLFKEKIISAEEYRQAQQALLSKQMVLPQIDVNRIAHENQIRDKQKEIDQLNHDIVQQGKIFEEALQTLKSNVTEWMRRYTLQAPTDGQIVFVLPLQQNQYIEQGRLLGYINPPNSQYYAQLKLSQFNFGKVDTGMQVQLRFEAYPYQEVGYVQGKLNYIANMAIDSGFLCTVDLPQGLLTNQHKTLQYKNGLRAQAIVITRDLNLLQRLYYDLVKALSVK